MSFHHGHHLWFQFLQLILMLFLCFFISCYQVAVKTQGIQGNLNRLVQSKCYKKSTPKLHLQGTSKAGYWLIPFPKFTSALKWIRSKPFWSKSRSILMSTSFLGEAHIFTSKLVKKTKHGSKRQMEVAVDDLSYYCLWVKIPQHQMWFIKTFLARICSESQELILHFSF